MTFHQTAFSVAQVADRWGVSTRHIYDLCAKGDLGHLRLGKSLIRITVERWGPIAKGGFPARLAED